MPFPQFDSTEDAVEYGKAHKDDIEAKITLENLRQEYLNTLKCKERLEKWFHDHMRATQNEIIQYATKAQLCREAIDAIEGKSNYLF